MAPGNFNCFYSPCPSTFPHIRDLVNHMRNEHSLESVSFVCNIDGCQHIHHSASTFRKHAMYCHSNRWNTVKSDVVSIAVILNTSSTSEAAASSTFEDACLVEPVGESVSEQVVENGVACFVEPLSESVDEQVVEKGVQVQQEKYTDLIQSIMKQFWTIRLRLCYDFHLPEWKTTTILDSVSDLLKLLKSEIGECLSVSEAGEVLTPEDVFILRDNASLDNVLNVTPAQEKLVLQRLGYIEPEEVVFSAESDTPKDCGHYVPVHKTLANYLSRPDVQASIQRELTQNRTDILHSMSSGHIMATHPVFSLNRFALRIKLYTDEFKIGNPLRANKQLSISGVYFSIDNIERHLSGKSTHIHLAFLVRESLLKKYSKGVVWGRLLQDLCRLECEGLQVEANGNQEKVDVGVAVICGDNKSLSDLGGFNCCFSSGKVCRKCMVEFSDLLLVRNESQCVLRTVENHDRQVQEVLMDDKLAREYGVTGPCEFSVLKSVHPVISLANDIMHDSYEGQMPFNITAVLKGLIHDKVVTMKDIHSLVGNFVYGACDADNKFPGFPAKFPSQNASFPGTAAQKRNLFRMFSLIVGPKVPPENKYWRLHLILQDICDILLAPSMEVGWLPVLDALVEEYISLWSQLPQVVVGSLKPKGHFLVHMAYQAYMFGPPRYVSCMGFEHFHLNFKKVASLMNNFRNPTLTMATAFQKKRCLEYSSAEICASTRVESAQSNVSIDTLSELEKNALKKFSVAEDAILLSVSKVKIQGRHFVKGAYVIVDVNHEGIPIFLKIVSIYRYLQQWIVYGKLTFPLRYSEHLHSYQVFVDDDDVNYVCVSPAEVVPLQTLNLYKVDGKPYLKLRHRPVPPQ